MVTRLLGIGDIHQHTGPRDADRMAALDQIWRESATIPELGATVILGDLFDAESTPEGRNALDEVIRLFAGLAPVLIVYGNHDQRGDLDGFARLKTRWPVYVFERPTLVSIRLATGVKASVFALPYPTRAGLVSAGIAKGDIVGVGAELLDPICLAAAAELETARRAGELAFVIGHANIVGAVASTGQPQWGHEIELSASHLDRFGAILKLFGHIHKPQTVSGAVYAGSVCRLDFGEVE